MRRYADVILNSQGVPQSTATLTVTKAATPAGSGALATIYSDDGITPTSNPVSTDSNGRFAFYVADGRYDLKAQLNTGANYIVSDQDISGLTEAALLGNIIIVDGKQYACSDVGLAAAMAATPSTGGVVNARSCGAMTWNSNMFASINKPILLQLGTGPITINAAQSPNAISTSIIGLGGAFNGSGTCKTSLNVNFASGDVFTPGANAQGFELGNLCVTAAVTRTSGFVINPAPGAHSGYVHDLFLLNQYAGFKLFAGGGLPLNNWFFNNIKWNFGSLTNHEGSYVSLGSTDNSVLSAGHMFTNFNSTGDLGIHDAPQFLIDSNVDSPQFVNIAMSISRTSTGTQPNWKFQNTLGSGIAPRLASLINVLTEGNGLTGNDIVNISAGTDLMFSNGDWGGGDHGFNISGGSGITINGGQVNNNNNGGIYVTSGVANLGLTIRDVNFYGNAVTSTNNFDDIQIADGTTNFSITDNHFDQIASTVTANLPRYAINVLGTTCAQFYIHGNQVNLSKIGTSFLRSVTAGTNKFIQTDQGRTTVFAGTNSTRLWLLDPVGTHVNWQLGVQENVGSALEITPSTVVGGTTFTTPSFIAATNGFGPVVAAFMPATPTIGSTHFNTSGDSIAASNGSVAFTVTVGTGAANSTGIVGLPLATTGWVCTASNRNRGAYIQQTASTTSSATFTNYGTTVGTPVNWTNSDVLAISCTAY